MPTGKQKRSARNRALQFAERDDRTRKRDRADAHADKNFDIMNQFFGLRNFVRSEISRKTDQHRRRADKAVQNSDKLRHRRHLHPRSDECANRRARNQHRRQHGVTVKRHPRRGRDERDQHSEYPVKIPAPRRFLPRQPAEAHNKQRARGDVCNCD